jgi:hypothetical protein
MPCPCSNIGVIPAGGTDSEVYTGNLRRRIETETPVNPPGVPVQACACQPVSGPVSTTITPAESAYLVTKIQSAPFRVYNPGAACGALPPPTPIGDCFPTSKNTPGNLSYRILPRESKIDRYALPARTQPGSTITARKQFAAAAAFPTPVYVIPAQRFNNCAPPVPSSGGVPKPSKFCINGPRAVYVGNPRH